MVWVGILWWQQLRYSINRVRLEFSGLTLHYKWHPVHAQRIIASQFRLTVAAARSTAFPCPLRSPYGISNPNYPSYVFISVLKAALTNTIHSKTSKLSSNYPFWVSLPKYLFQYHVLKTAVRFETPIALPAAHRRFYMGFEIWTTFTGENLPLML